MPENNYTLLTCAVLWTMCLFMDVISAITGGSPSWSTVLCPLFILVINYWIEFIKRTRKPPFRGE